MILLKVGGGKTINWEYIAHDLKNLKEKVVIIHGANARMKEISDKLGIKEKTILSPSGHTSRYTDDATMDILTMVYSGLVNKKVVAILQKYNINAIGLSGADGKLWLGKRKEVILSAENGKVKTIRDSHTGNIESVNSSLIRLLVHDNYTPVVTIPAITATGELINIDNDRAVAAMVKDLNIKKIIMLFEAPGLLDDRNDERTLIKKIHSDLLDNYINKTEGRMRKKLLGIKEAIINGAEIVYFGDGRKPDPIATALSGGGTTIKKYE